MADIDEQKIIFMNKEEMSLHTVEDLHSLDRNKWKNWWCSAGMRSLYIQHDGLVYRGTCQVGDVLGSIYNEGIDQLEELYSWVKCDKDVCACGTDMKSPKVKSYEDISIVTPRKIKNIDFEELKIVDQVKDATITFSGAFREYKLVIWELGRRCNYDCWYCFPDSHNSYESHKSLGSLMHGLANLSRFWGNNTKMKFVFTGGEPTFNPNFLEFVTHLHDDLFHIVHTTTNGSHTPAYYSKLMQVSDISFSAHLTYLETPAIYKKFVSNVKTAFDTKNSVEGADLNWLDVRIMLQPGKLELAKQLHSDCKATGANVNIDLLHGLNKKILSYSTDEINWMIESNSNV
jgi:MoaA/NifB/PqqE/SkfB family radical SAM enzyme